MLNIKQEIDKTKHCKLFFEIEEIFANIEQKMTTNLLEQMLNVFEEHEKETYAEPLDSETQVRLAIIV